MKKHEESKNMLINGNRMFWQLDMQDHVILTNPSLLAVCLWRDIAPIYEELVAARDGSYKCGLCLMTSERSNSETLA